MSFWFVQWVLGLAQVGGEGGGDFNVEMTVKARRSASAFRLSVEALAGWEKIRPSRSLFSRDWLVSPMRLVPSWYPAPKMLKGMSLAICGM